MAPKLEVLMLAREVLNTCLLGDLSNWKELKIYPTSSIDQLKDYGSSKTFTSRMHLCSCGVPKSCVVLSCASFNNMIYSCMVVMGLLQLCMS